MIDATTGQLIRRRRER